MFSLLSRRCPLLATSLSVLFCLLSMLISDSRFDLVWFHLSCDHGWIRSGSVNNVRKQHQQLHCLLFCCIWCPCMTINNVNVQYNGGFLPDIILLTQCYYRRRTRLNVMKRFHLYSLWPYQIILKFFPLTGGCSEDLDEFRFFFKHKAHVV